MSTFAVRIDVDGTMTEIKQKPVLEDYQKAVGGWIEAVSLGEATGYLNEEGKIQGLPPNPFATSLFHEFGGDRRDYIAGPMVIVGGADRNGEDTAISEAWLARLRPVVPS